MFHRLTNVIERKKRRSLFHLTLVIIGGGEAKMECGHNTLHFFYEPSLSDPKKWLPRLLLAFQEKTRVKIQEFLMFPSLVVIHEKNQQLAGGKANPPQDMSANQEQCPLCSLPPTLCTLCTPPLQDVSQPFLDLLITVSGYETVTN